METDPFPSSDLPLNQVVVGDCRDVLGRLPESSIDLVFADPPYNLQLTQNLLRPNRSLVDGVDDAWDQFSTFEEYDAFTREWLTACRRVLKPGGTLWVIGTYHNIYRVGAILQNLNFWILNDVVWIKTNPMPNFRGVRLTNAHETLIWALKERSARYTFNHHALKSLNDDLQMRSDWLLPICFGKERLRIDGKKVHNTQKPESLLYRILIASTNPGDVVLDPFFGTGTTGAVARSLNRSFIGIERDPAYAEVARQRIAAVLPEVDPALYASPNPRRERRLPFGRLLEEGLLKPGQMLYFDNRTEMAARILSDGSIEYNEFRGSIHKLARHLALRGPSNGWLKWYFQDPKTGQRQPIDRLRQILRARLSQSAKE